MPKNTSSKPRPERSLLHDESARLLRAEPVVTGFIVCCLVYAVFRLNGFL